MGFDIFNSEERKVVCVSNKDHNFFSSDDNAPLLTIGEQYTVSEVEIYSWHTDVYLKEFPGVHFNSVCFEEIE